MLKRWLLLALSCSLASAQSSIIEPSVFSSYPSDALIQQWIGAADPRLTAWGAHFILAAKRDSLLPLVETEIERWEAVRKTKPDAMQDRAMTVLLDTEIQLGGKVSADALVHLDSSFDTQRLVLLRNVAWEEAEPVWRSMYRSKAQDGYQDARVAAQILAQRPPAGFATEVLRHVEVKAHVIVHDAGGGVGFGSSSCGIGCGMRLMPELTDWPEAAFYQLLDPPRNGSAPPPADKLWLEGPDPIYLRRTVNRTYAFSNCEHLGVLTDAMTSHIVGTMLGGNPASPFPERTVDLDIGFRDRESYRAQVVALVEQQQQNFNQVARALTARGMLTEEERQAAALAMELTLRDFRTERNVDLPVIVFRSPVHWAASSPN